MTKKIKKSAKKLEISGMSKPKKASAKKPEVKFPRIICLYETCPICDGVETAIHHPTIENRNYTALFSQSEISNAMDRYGGSFERVDREIEHKDLRNCIRCLKAELRTIGVDGIKARRAYQTY